MIGQDSRGNWVVRDQSGLRGGLFIGRAEALRYVRFETGDHPSVIVMVNGAFEVDTSGTRRPAIVNRFNAEEPRTRRIA
jgi:hypothetical protein